MKQPPRITSLRLLAALWLTLVCGGCAHAPAVRGADRDAQGRIVLNYWNGFTGPDGKTMTGDGGASSSAANPDIRVKMQIIPWSTYYDKLTLSHWPTAARPTSSSCQSSPLSRIRLLPHPAAH